MFWRAVYRQTGFHFDLKRSCPKGRRDNSRSGSGLRDEEIFEVGFGAQAVPVAPERCDSAADGAFVI